MNLAVQIDQTGGHPAWVCRQVVTFVVANQVFATPIESVREIRGWQKTTPVPNAEPNVTGVLNLRGAIIAIYDLRRSLGLPPNDRTSSSVTIVIDTGDKLVGILADSVSDILDVSPDDLRDPPTSDPVNGPEVVGKFIVKGETVISLLNIEAVVN
ncbi:chemotaxis protein CheW [uncultured Alsobacter sp.]|uniref:chemotaxis protein CheW n=1 Tax=uncultured Alsobacter sp. TaxID=1748258 RepID=UPI0025E6F67A|nr:chemotaxis protein CheW [uncultured Alsobacter sp.]